MNELISDRACEACDRGEEKKMSPYSSVFPNPMPVHRPSGMICSKAIPDKIWDALKAAKEKRDAARDGGK